MYHLRKQEAIHQVELMHNITLLTSVELLCGRIKVTYLFHERLDVKALLYLIILLRLKRYHDSITDLTSSVNNGSLQLNLLQKHMLFLNVTARYSWNRHTQKSTEATWFLFFFCINPGKKNLAERILPKLEGTVLLAFQKHYMLTKWMSTCIYFLAWIAYPSQKASWLRS